jgi:hypothetical protein
MLEEMASLRKNVTGVDNTVFISGSDDGDPRIMLAIDPPQSISPICETASVAIRDGTPLARDIPPPLLAQARPFIDLNRAALMEYWEYRIDTEELGQRLQSI